MMKWIPQEFRETALSDWQSFCQEIGQERKIHFAALGEFFLKTLFKVWVSSPFVASFCRQNPALLEDLVDSGDLFVDRTLCSIHQLFVQQLADIHSDDQLMSALRQLRNREMARIAWRDIAGWASLDATLTELSWFADASVEAALQFHYRALIRSDGVPRATNGTPLSLVVLGMGKLGAYELNFSSDIDLIFAFAEDGETDKKTPISHEEFFHKLSQKIVNTLATKTHNGFVYRVDMRLRPFGSAGPLALSFDAMEDYYQSQGREWERYAMIKARPIAGDIAAGTKLLKSLRPFVYRRYLDYGVLAGLRDMKDMIDQQLKRKGLHGNIKLGKGGIREIEFIGQTFQLVRGGRDPDLQIRALQPLLQQLSLKGHITKEAAQQLLHAYRFLRLIENRLQQVGDEQTHLLPVDARERTRLAFSLQQENWKSLHLALEQQMAWVQSQFEQVFFSQQVKTENKNIAHASSLWKGEVEDWDKEQNIVQLKTLGFDQPSDIFDRLSQWKAAAAYKRLSATGKERLDQLLPALIASIAKYSHKLQAVSQLLATLDTILGRTVYLSLLYENPHALDQFVKLCIASAWIAKQVAQQPILLDEMIDPARLVEPFQKDKLEEELASRQRNIAQEDYEQILEMLRQFKQANVLKVAAVDLLNLRPLMVVSDYLTLIAEKLIEQCLKYSWDYVVKRFGAPSFVKRNREQPQGFAVIAYGKLGGLELGYGSDLDLVFLHQDLDDEGHTSGAQSIADAEFFIRLAQRFINMMMTNMPSGILYEIDLRLRPHGESGFLVSSLQSFREYQSKDAWIWEHQALVRARGVAGDLELIASFAQVRAEILCRIRDEQILRTAIVEMRERMRRELLNPKADYMDLKQSIGGIIDIEFILQYGVLRWSHQFPELVQYPDNVRVSEQLGNLGCIRSADAKLLKEAYLTYRSAVHKLALQECKPRVNLDEYKEYRAAVVEIWSRVFLPTMV